MIVMLAYAGAAAVDTAAAPSAGDDHQSASAAMSALQTAIGDIDRAERLGTEGPDTYRDAAQSAINDLVGPNDDRYRNVGGKTATDAGALPRLNALSDRSGKSPWAAPISAARVNVIAAVTQLTEALHSSDLDHFQLHASDALELLEMAVGRSTEIGPLGGLSGALATTGLGVPVHGRVTNGCSLPKVAPASGVVDGYLMYVALPANGKSATLPQALGTTFVSRNGDILVLHTAARKLESKLCGRQPDPRSKARQMAAVHAGAADPVHAGSDPQHGASADPPSSGTKEAASDPASNDPPGKQSSSSDPSASSGKQASSGGSSSGSKDSSSSSVSDSADAGNASSKDSGSTPPALYTEKQASAGRQIFRSKCVACHGKNLQGKSAPSVAGDDFLSAAQRNGWSVDDLRSIVAYNMPFNEPGSLSKKQAADVIAYLLASNCYPAGDKPFPEKETKVLGKTKLTNAKANKPSDAKLGTCNVN
ncbi:MAG: c-type cytochrome [Betaproteobacteria bacterium]|nr:c-type cytochrome [Betaproteobacteria bacterium]